MDRFMRLELLIGKEKRDKLKQSHVLVVGLGGVGGYVVESLARSGIGKLTLIDFDIIDITNSNRQVIAVTSTIGKSKATSWKERILDINPEAEVIIHEVRLTKDNVEDYINPSTDAIIDACDTLEVKKELIRYSLKNNKLSITVTGTALKKDPSKLEVMELQKTTYDPIARELRKMVKLEFPKRKLMVVCSTESPMKRVTESLPSAVFVPSVAGILAANYIFKKLIGE